MKKNIILPLMLTLFLSASCEEKNVLNAEIDFEQQTNVQPKELINWPHALFVFDNRQCTDIKMTQNENSLRAANVKGGDRMTAVSYESSENIEFSHTTPGHSSIEYYLSVADVNGNVPRIWFNHGVLNEKNRLKMVPLTSEITVNLLNAPDSLASFSFLVPKMADVFYLSSGKTEFLNTLQDKKIDIPGQETGKQYVLFPMMKPEDKWELNYTIKFKHSSLSGSMDISKGIGAGLQLEMNVDFTRYTQENSYSLELRRTCYGENNWTEERENFFNLLPGDDAYQDVNDYYNVYVFQDNKWKSVEVRNALCSNAPGYHGEIWNDWNNSKKLRDTMCYVNFIDDFKGPVKIRVQKRKGLFNSVKVRPTSYGINPVKYNENTVEFILSDWEKRKVSVEFDEDRYHNLFMYPNRPDKNRLTQSENNVKYYAAGEHIAGEIKLYENETLYIDEDAVVYGNIKVLGNNVTITGRGVLSGEKLPHIGSIYAEGPVLIEARDVNNLTLSGITIIDSPSWTIALFSVNHLKIDNINMICWILNGDGIDLCSVSEATINDCFIRTYDDCITLKILRDFYTDTKDISVRNCLFWSDYARGVMVGPECGDWTWGTGTINNCLFENCVVLEQPSGDGDFRAAISIVQQEQHGGGAALMDNITFRNIEIDNLQATGRPICIEQTPQPRGGTMQNVLLQNVRILDSKGYKYKSSIKTNNSWITNLIFDNVTYNGEKITGAGDKLDVQGNVDISYK